MVPLANAVIVVGHGGPADRLGGGNAYRPADTEDGPKTGYPDAENPRCLIHGQLLSGAGGESGSRLPDGMRTAPERYNLKFQQNYAALQCRCFLASPLRGRALFALCA